MCFKVFDDSVIYYKRLLYDIMRKEMSVFIELVIMPTHCLWLVFWKEDKFDKNWYFLSYRHVKDFGLVFTCLACCLVLFHVTCYLVGAVVVVILWLLDLQQHVQSVPITTKLWVRIPLMARHTWYSIMWWSFSVTCDRSVVFSGDSDFLHH